MRENFTIVGGEQLARAADTGIEDGYKDSFSQASPFGMQASVARQASGARAYVVQEGDTLQRIAQAVWGDSSLWYAIAEANGLASSAAYDPQNNPSGIRAGQVLTLPDAASVGVGSRSSASTLRPYDPTEAIGNTAPNLPPPPRKKGSLFGRLIALVVAIAIAYFTGLNVSTSLGIDMTTVSASSLAVAAGAGAAGSAAGQLTGTAAGIQDHFSWKGVALAAIGGAVGQWVAPGLSVGKPTPAKALATTSYKLFNTMANAAIGSVITQGIGVVTGLQDKFEWRGVAASAVGAGVGQSVSPAFGEAFGGANAFGARLATGLVAGTAAAMMRGGKVVIQQVAVDAFGNALGESLASASQPETQGFGPNSGMDYRNGMDIESDAFYAPGAGWAADAAARKQSADPLGLRAYVNDVSGVMRSAQSLWGSAPSGMNSRAFSDTSTNAELLESQMHHAGYDDGLMPTGGGNVRVTPGMVNGVSVNQRVNNAFQAAGDLAGIGDMYRDYRLLGGLMGEVQQQATIDRLKGTLQDKLGMMRVLPTPEAMGAVPGVGSDGVPRFNNADLIERYSDAVRKVELMKQGVIELDTRSMLITSVGTGKLSPAQWVAENTRRYGDALAVGMTEGQRQLNAGTLRYPLDMPGQLQVGLFADNAARGAVIRYNQSIGVPEGPGQLLSMNRWSYDPSGSGAYNRIDLLMDLGPSRNNGAMILRTAIEGKGSIAAVQSSASQLQRVYDWVTPNVRTVTPQGVLPWTPAQPRRLK